MANIKENLKVMDATIPQNGDTDEKKAKRKKAFNEICDDLGINRQKCLGSQLIA